MDGGGTQEVVAPFLHNTKPMLPCCQWFVELLLSAVRSVSSIELPPTYETQQKLPSTPLSAVSSHGLRHFANGGCWYVSSNNLGAMFGKKGGHLLGNATSLCLHGLAWLQAGRGGGRRVGELISTSTLRGGIYHHSSLFSTIMNICYHATAGLLNFVYLSFMLYLP